MKLDPTTTLKLTMACSDSAILLMMSLPCSETSRLPSDTESSEPSCHDGGDDGGVGMDENGRCKSEGEWFGDRERRRMQRASMAPLMQVKVMVTVKQESMPA